MDETRAIDPTARLAADPTAMSRMPTAQVSSGLSQKADFSVLDGYRRVRSWHEKAKTAASAVEEKRGRRNVRRRWLWW